MKAAFILSVYITIRHVTECNMSASLRILLSDLYEYNPPASHPSTVAIISPSRLKKPVFVDTQQLILGFYSSYTFSAVRVEQSPSCRQPP